VLSRYRTTQLQMEAQLLKVAASALRNPWPARANGKLKRRFKAYQGILVKELRYGKASLWSVRVGVVVKSESSNTVHFTVPAQEGSLVDADD
jgi:hypothetical protein